MTEQQAGVEVNEADMVPDAIELRRPEIEGYGFPQRVLGREGIDIALRHGVFQLPGNGMSSLPLPGANIRPRSPLVFGDLAADQREIHNIVLEHLMSSLAGEPRPRLLMVVTGAAGTGKTALAHALLEAFGTVGELERIAVTATTGSSAALVGGPCVEQWSSLHMFGKGRGLVDHQYTPIASGVTYLVVDHCSRLRVDYLTLLSRALAHSRGNHVDPFGGVNVILLADMFQLHPPPGQTYALYSMPPGGHSADVDGELYGKFSTVVALRSRKNNCESEWNMLLERLRTASCVADDIVTLQGRTLGVVESPDFSTAPWNSATLIATRHALIEQWNVEAIERAVLLSKTPVYVCSAVDTVKGRSLTSRELAEVKKIRPCGGLLSDLVLITGMPVSVQVDDRRFMATVLHVELHDDEARVDRLTLRTQLRRLPLAVWVRTVGYSPETTLRIAPTRATFKWDGTPVWREQLPLSPAYAVSVALAEGHIFERAVVDIAPAPRGLSPIEAADAYSALSRVTCSKHLILLREFDAGVLTRGVREELALDDERLTALARARL